MARTYKRDSRGRFSGSGGGGGGGAKGGGGKAPKAAPKTTSARGRARSNAAAARAAVKAGGGKKAQQSLAIAERASRRYQATGTGTKRSATKAAKAQAAPASKPAASKGSVASRKAAMNREVTRTVLGGKATQGQRNPQRERYISAQNRNELAMERKGKGSKAARRAAKIKR